jgi:TldD protein
MARSLIESFDCPPEKLRSLVADTISGADDGELFMEYREGEALVFDNGRLKTANFNTDQGFGLRAVAGEATGYAHSSELSEAALLRAADAVSAVKHGYSGTLAGPPAGTNQRLYGEENPIAAPAFEEKARLRRRINVTRSASGAGAIRSCSSRASTSPFLTSLPSLTFSSITMPETLGLTWMVWTGMT